MIDIKRDNYELYFIDYLEGLLSESEVKQLLSFLKDNPDLKLELERNDFQPLVPDKTNFLRKIEIKRTCILNDNQKSNFDELCIACIENDLTEKQLSEFNMLIIGDYKLNYQFQLFKKTVLVPDLTVTFTKKSYLKTHSLLTGQISRYRYLIMAASVVLVFAISVLLPKKINNSQNNFIVSSNINKINPYPEIENSKFSELIKKDFKEDNKKSTSQQIKFNRDNLGSLSEKNGEINRENISLILPCPVSVKKNELKKNLKNPFKSISNQNLYLIENSTNSRSIKDLLVHSFNKQFFKDKNDARKINSVDFADFAIIGINKIAGTKMSINKKYDSDGNITNIEFNSKLIAFSTTLKN